MLIHVGAYHRLISYLIVASGYQYVWFIAECIYAGNDARVYINYIIMP